ncbi:MAG: hypothetical protein A7315_05985 [Candidatus Altiarchaeales archaeon WOR_SM1_79]|nr:MAG: hypothetical protein A7315_05985 [Candidatus Altiarchaeales archaeon WOR_SM1_79]
MVWPILLRIAGAVVGWIPRATSVLGRNQSLLFVAGVTYTVYEVGMIVARNFGTIEQGVARGEFAADAFELCGGDLDCFNSVMGEYDRGIAATGFNIRDTLIGIGVIGIGLMIANKLLSKK